MTLPAKRFTQFGYSSLSVTLSSMKKPGTIALLFCACSVFSCEYNSTTPETGYIKATIDGVQSRYTSPDVLGTVYYAQANEFHIAFYDESNSYARWAIDVVGVDLQHATFPVVISGPNEAEVQPIFGCNIYDSDPTQSVYGRVVAGTNSLYWNTTLIITSFDGSMIKGTFEGEGIGSDQQPRTFAGGQFLARVLQR
jgi:hypothetical protein